MKNNSKQPKCTNPEKCLQLLESIMDGEASFVQKLTYKGKLRSCEYCYDYFHITKSVKNLIQAKIKNVDVPDGLVDDIRQKVQDSKEIDV